jgi:hypothetical protein
MKTSQKFKEKFTYQSLNFQEWFGGIEFKKDTKKIFSTVLKEDMNDEKILKELKPTPVSLGQIFNEVEKLDKDEWNIFYCNDVSGVLRAVRVDWNDDGWIVIAYPVGLPGAWVAGLRVFSASPFSPQNSPPDPLSLEEAIKICQDNGLTVSKVY